MPTLQMPEATTPDEWAEACVGNEDLRTCEVSAVFALSRAMDETGRVRHATTVVVEALNVSARTAQRYVRGLAESGLLRGHRALYRAVLPDND